MSLASLLDLAALMVSSPPDDDSKETGNRKKQKHCPTSTTFGQKGRGFHREHHRWCHRLPFPKDLCRSQIHVKVMKPLDVIFDPTILDLAREASDIAHDILTKTYTAAPYNARMILKVKITTISDGTVIGSIAANQNPASGWGYAGLGMSWKLVSNDIMVQEPRIDGVELVNLLPVRAIVPDKPGHVSNIELQLDPQVEVMSREIPYDPRPYDGGYEIAEQSMSFEEIFSGKNHEIQTVYELAQECAYDIISRIGTDEKSFQKTPNE